MRGLCPLCIPIHHLDSTHLSLLQREGIISCWYDGLIGAGQQWRREIEAHLNSANIILLFVSADFLASDFCMETELPVALARSSRREALVIPVIVRECDWQTASFAHLQALPGDRMMPSFSCSGIL
ncbi:MAG TPA: toll/interleukin-1 receptor domain-containing protein [Ktedonobacteraceae bacterium]|nr:toll/interleukin-1 receptor domain-containing protein [Ktedonobacteraceae bacterium]